MPVGWQGCGDSGLGPFFPILYLWRKKGYALSLLAITSLSLFGSGSIVSLSTVVADSSVSEFAYQKQLLAFVPDVSGHSLPDFQTYVEGDPRVERALPATIRTLRSTVFASPLTYMVNLRAEDTEYLMGKLQLKVVSGRMFMPGTNEVMLSERQVKARKLKLGDVFGDEDTDWDRSPARLVGILGGSTSLALGSFEYSRNVIKRPPVVVVTAKSEGDMRSLVADLLETPFGRDLTHYARTYEYFQGYLEDLNLILFLIVAINTVVLALIVSLLGYISLSHRLPELCIFSAMGYARRSLLSRLAIEFSVILSLGWILGLAMSSALFQALAPTFFEPRGMIPPAIAWQTIEYTIPTVAVLITVSLGVAAFCLYNLDTIATIDGH